MRKAEEIKKIVRDKYAEIAISGSEEECGCCCSDKPGGTYTVFSESYESREGYLADADLGLGCGLPTEYAMIEKGNSVLDLGSGAGNDCFVARSLVGETGKVTGLDFTDEMLELARANNKKMGYTNVEFVKGDIEKMPFTEGSFDVIISNCVLNLVPDKGRAFSEISRVLNNNGHFCVSDIVLKGDLPDDLREAATLYAGCVSGAIQFEDYLNHVKMTGFKDVKVKKEREVNVPDDLLLTYISPEKLTEYRNSGTGIYSITVVGKKQS